MVGSYFEELCAAMQKLAADPRVVFLGQSVAYAGTAMSRTLDGVSASRKIEMPVAEDMQMGMATGMALQGLLPVCIYPRWNFLLLATNQLVLHLDKLPLYSRGKFKPRVLIRTAVATNVPLHPGAQHLGDFTDPFRQMLTTVHVHRLESAYDVRDQYALAYGREYSTILVEHASLY